jgi:uncharacterized repeat protein (TIGR01451 family)
MMTRAVFALIGVALLGVALSSVSLPAQAIGATRTWTGGDVSNSNWSDPDNWDTGAPVAGDLLVFPQTAARKSNMNDLAPGTTFESITFTGSGYSITGNDLDVGIGLVNAPASGTNVVDLDVGGAGGVLNTSGRLVLGGNNSYAGATLVDEGMVSAQHDSALGATATGTTVDDGATLEVAGGIGTGTEVVTITGDGVDGFGALQSPGGTNVMGTVRIFGETTIGVGNSVLVVNQLNQVAGGAELTLVGGGKLQVESAMFAGPVNAIEGNLTWNASSQVFVEVQKDAWLRGLGTVSTAHTIGGLIWPGSGNAPGVLTVVNATEFSGGRFRVDLDGPTPGSEYGQLRTAGVSLTSNATLLEVELGYIPLIGQVFRIIDNEGGAVSGTFFGLPEGGLVTGAGYVFQISYKGGDGNDVTLTVIRQLTADLKLAMTASPSPVAAGGNLTYSITLTNDGPDAASSPRVSMGTPVGTTFVSATGPANWVCSQPAPSVSVSCTGPSFSNGATANFTFVFKVNNGASGTVSGTAGVSSDTNDPFSANNAVTLSTSIGPGGSLGFKLRIPFVARD